MDGDRRPDHSAPRLRRSTLPRRRDHGEKAVFKTQRGFTVGHAGLGQHGRRRGTAKQQVHDGDTVIVDPAGNLSVRFLGVDTPEVSFTLPNQALEATDRRPDESLFVPIADARWERFLADPFAAGLRRLVLRPGVTASPRLHDRLVAARRPDRGHEAVALTTLSR